MENPMKKANEIVKMTDVELTSYRLKIWAHYSFIVDEEDYRRRKKD